EENIEILVKELVTVLNTITNNYEIIFIDDGSTDRSFEKLLRLKNEYPIIKIVKFKKNAGQSAALAAGFQKAKNDIVITLDADLQNDPADIPKMLKKLEEGYDVVIGYRQNRQDSLIKKISSIIGNFVRNTITKEKIKDTGCSLKVFKREYLQKIFIFKGMHRFLPTLLKLTGAKLATINVNHRERKYGESKYGISNRMLSGLYDCISVRWLKKRYVYYEIEKEI
ncbi:MAG TPA: glycosyltransferase family 2 protein, partial [bacterium]|nr:glycosyltransferase family 2 protein [bacterium]